MREILFRAKSEDNYPYPSRWEYGVPFEDSYGSYVMKTSYGLVDIKKDTVGEYTGLTDKNGVKIFEGDIVECKYVLGVITYQIGTARNDYTAGFIVSWIFADYLRQELGFWATQRDINVIGNIHDNPELLGDDT